jgi:hypothetical protein
MSQFEQLLQEITGIISFLIFKRRVQRLAKSHPTNVSTYLFHQVFFAATLASASRGVSLSKSNVTVF